MTFNKLLDTAFLNEIAKATNAGFQAGVKWQKEQEAAEVEIVVDSVVFNDPNGPLFKAQDGYVVPFEDVDEDTSFTFPVDDGGAE